MKPYKIVCGDVLAFLRTAETVDCIIADPPDNIGLRYGEFVDTVSAEEYYSRIELLILESLRLCKTLWLSYYWKHDLRIKSIIERVLRCRHPAFGCKTFIWRFAFGQHNTSDCGSGFRFIVRLSRVEMLGQDIKVESERQRLGDARAAVGGRVPDDVWDFPRVCGTHAERQAWHPTQHPQGLMARMIRLCGAKSVYDLYSGTGTVLRVCKEMGVECTSVEIDQEYCRRVGGDLGIIFER